MKKLLACSMLLAAFVSQAQTNILLDPGFDENYQGNGVAGNWTKETTGSPGMTCTEDTINTHSGAACQQVKIANISAGTATLYQGFTFQPGAVYNASLWVRSSAPGMQIQLNLQDADYYNEDGAVHTYTTTNTGWQQIIINGGWQFPGGDGAFNISFEDNGTYWVDDAGLTNVTSQYLAAPLQNPGATVPTNMFGLQINKMYSTNWPPINQQLIRLWGTVTYWAALETSSNGYPTGGFMWTHLDDWTNFFLTNNPNCQIMYTMGQTPQWASDNPEGTPSGNNGLGANFAPQYMFLWSNYVYQVDHRYRGIIKYYEVWNEWDNANFYNDSVSNMVEMTILAKEVLNTNDSSAVLVAPVVTIDGFDKLEQFIQMGGSNVPDIYAYHDYPTSIPEQCLPATVGIQNMLANNGITKPLWVTEGAPDEPNPTSPDAAMDQGIAARVFLYFCSQNVQNFDWYTWDIITVNNTNQVPLGGPGHVAAPAGIAYSMLATNWLGGARLISRMIDSNDTWQLQVQQSGKPYNYIVWNPYSNAVFNISSNWYINQERNLSNKVTNLAGISSITAGISPVILDSTNPTITVDPLLLSAATVDTAYSQNFSAIGGISPYTFAVTGGSLPPNFTLSSGGALSGTPTNSGNYSFTVTATDANTYTGSRSYTLALNCPPIAIGPATLSAGTNGMAYNQTNTAIGGTAPYTFTLLSGSLPPGLTLSSSGVISGTPNSYGISPLTVTATDFYGCTGSQSYTVTIIAAPAFTVQPQSQTVPIGNNVTLTVVATGNPAPSYQWYFNSANMSGAVGSSLAVNNFQTTNQGNYYATASNEAGSATSQIAVLYVAEPLRFVNPYLTGSNGWFSAQVVGPSQTNFAVDDSTDLMNWTTLSTNPAPDGILNFMDTNQSGEATRFYRAWLAP